MVISNLTRLTMNCTNFSKNILFFAVEKVVVQNLPHRKVAKREISLIETSKGLANMGNSFVIPPATRFMIVSEWPLFPLIAAWTSDLVKYFFIFII